MGLSGEPEKENTLGKINALKDGDKKSKKVKRENLKEISNGSSVDDVCQNKKSKKAKLCNGNDKMETKVEEDHGKIYDPKALGANYFPELLTYCMRKLLRLCSDR